MANAQMNERRRTITDHIAMTPAFYKMDPVVSGNTFNGKTFTVSVNEIPSDLTGVQIRLSLRSNSPLGPIQKSMIIGDGITLTYPTLGQFEIDAQRINLPAGQYYYDILFLFPSGVAKTFIAGTWLITNSINPII